MARTKKSVDYFPHFIGGIKMRYIRKKFGNDGYAVWFILLEALATTDDHHIALGREMAFEIEFTILADDCGVEVDKLEAIINELVKLGQLNKKLWEESKVLYSEQLRDSLVYAYAKRKSEIITTMALEQKYLGITPQLKVEQEIDQETEDETDLATTDGQPTAMPKAAPPSSPSSVTNLHEIKINEKKDFRNLLEKDVIFISNTCKRYRIIERAFWDKAKIFIDEQEGFSKLINRTYVDLRQHFYRWLNLNLQHERRNKKARGPSTNRRKPAGKIIDPNVYEQFRSTV